MLLYLDLNSWLLLALGIISYSVCCFRSWIDYNIFWDKGWYEDDTLGIVSRSSDCISVSDLIILFFNSISVGKQSSLSKYFQVTVIFLVNVLSNKINFTLFVKIDIQQFA